MFAVEQAASDARGKLRHSRVYPIKIARTTISSHFAGFTVLSGIYGKHGGSPATVTSSLFFERIQRDTKHLIFDGIAPFVSSYKVAQIFLVASHNADLRTRNLQYARCARGRKRGHTRFVSLPHASQAEIRGNNAKTARKRTLHAHRVHHPGNFR